MLQDFHRAALGFRPVSVLKYSPMDLRKEPMAHPEVSSSVDPCSSDARQEALSAGALREALAAAAAACAAAAASRSVAGAPPRSRSASPGSEMSVDSDDDAAAGGAASSRGAADSAKGTHRECEAYRTPGRIWDGNSQSLHGYLICITGYA